jgi:transporter family-2 protein
MSHVWIANFHCGGGACNMPGNRLHSDCIRIGEIIMTSPLAASAGSLWMPLGVALLAGAMIPFQAGSNATLGRALGHPLWATVVSLLISLVAVVPVLLALRAPPPNLAAAAGTVVAMDRRAVRRDLHHGGAVAGARMGAANFIVGAVAGQLLASMLVDHFGLGACRPGPSRWRAWPAWCWSWRASASCNGSQRGPRAAY